MINKECEFCKSINLRKSSVFCSISCKNKKWYLINKIKIAKKYDKNKDNILKYKKEYYDNNKQLILKRNKKWKSNNIDWLRNYHNNRTYSNKERICNSLRSRLNTAIRGKYKSGSAIGDLGCSVEYLKRYLENQFQEDMSWDNYGLKGWHIDHIKPLDSFNLTEEKELKKACHYTNLQPLWAKDNLSKGAKYESISKI